MKARTYFMVALLSGWLTACDSPTTTTDKPKDSTAGYDTGTSQQANGEKAAGEEETAPVNKDLMTSLSTIKQSELVTTEPPPEAPASNMEAPAGPDTSQAPKGQLVADMSQGEVLEIIASPDGISYIQLERADDTVWVAVRSFDVEVGDLGQIKGKSIVMENFHSKSLDRTFDKLMLSSELNKVDPNADADAADTDATQ